MNNSLPTFNKAVLLVSFRRADLTARVLEVIRLVRPARLYLATDAPREDRPSETAACAEVRHVLNTFANGIDWPCEVRRDDARANLGARRRMISAISWMLEIEPDGLILEDDCLPLETFFPYCAELLDRYRDEPRVMGISGGRGGEAGEPQAENSFYFSKYPRIWGWATWRRAWALYDEHLAGWDEYQRSGQLDAMCFDSRERAHHVHLVNLTLRGGLDAWDYQWLISCWMHKGMSIVPKVDQIVNIGFRADATHTTMESHGWLVQKACALDFPLHAPSEIREDLTRDFQHWQHSLKGPSLIWRGSRKLRSLTRAVVARLAGWWRAPAESTPLASPETTLEVETAEALSRPFTTPVLLVAFRRPDLTRQVLEVLRRVRPLRLYLAVDAARPGYPEEEAAVAEVKALLAEIDWPCEVRRDYAPLNLGSGGRVPTAITWMFEHEEAGIILEDDCLPHPSFFRFCAELLDRYRGDTRVMGISGQTGASGRLPKETCYFFSKYTRTWGWATWRRAWRHYDHELTAWQKYRYSKAFRARCFHEEEASYWRTMLEVVTTREVNAWDFRWLMACWQHGGLVATATANLVTNLGFRDDATHTGIDSHGHLRHSFGVPSFPLVHPERVVQDEGLDFFFWQTCLRPPNFVQRVRRKLWRFWRQLRRRVGQIPTGSHPPVAVARTIRS